MNQDKQDKVARAGHPDEIGMFDPLLSAVSPKGDYPFYRAGYMFWPHPRAAEAAAVRMMSIGNSTSLWPNSDWSRQLAERLTKAGHDIGLWHGAGKGNSSTQELMRVLRDAPAIRPHLIVSLSGICDIGYLLNSKNYPFAHKYIRRMLDFARDHGFADEITYGYPDPVTPAQTWCRNQRMMHILAQSQGIRLLTFLQPVLGIGRYDMDAQEAALLAEKSAVVLQAADLPYGDAMRAFYAEVHEILAGEPDAYPHVVDITDVFADCPGAYRDHRHQSPKGVTHLSAAMQPFVSEALAEIAGTKKPRQRKVARKLDVVPLAATHHPAIAALEAHHNPKDEMQFFDPYLSVIGPTGGHPRTVGGYKLWPDTEPEGEVTRLMTMGNSTSLLPYYPWSTELAEALTAQGIPVELWHGAGKGNSSSQELMRVLRDAPVIKPALILSLSGICDIGYLLNHPEHPHLHKYARRVFGFAQDAGLVTRDVVCGPPDTGSPAEIWCRNQRMMRVLADEQGAEIITFLQPVQGYGPYPQSPEEEAFYARKAQVVLEGAGKPYGVCVTEFYTEVLEIIGRTPEKFDHVIDFTGVFSDCPGAYKDHRHQSPKGATHLALRMLPIVADRLSHR